ncbi:MAG: hypothetical protein AB1486_11755 [Planctomycetota bacterium]
MPKILKAKVRELIHDYKVGCFKLVHDPEAHAAVEREAETLVRDLLSQEFHYHFHREVDPHRAESINLIHWYASEALLPPVLRKIAERILVLEKRAELHLEFMRRTLELVSEEGEPLVSPS